MITCENGGAMTSSPSSLLDAAAVFPHPGGGIAWVPPELPVVATEDDLTMTVADWIASYGVPKLAQSAELVRQ